ncbi:MAG TPA: DUF5723 family protein [Bacteroidales bacterium]|nr:DUF5723 family protein [Bacteroidales bacterium]HRZ48615.1 DUF5723 family protein [Bacteroidales bacterium]
MKSFLKYLGLLLMGIHGILHAQDAALFRGETDSLRISVSGDINAGSTSLSNASWSNLMSGGYIDADKKNLIGGSLREVNLAGAQYRAEISALFSLRNLTSRDSVFGVGGISYFNLEELRFGKPVALVALNGNHPYEGSEVTLKHLAYNRLEYQHLFIGACKLSKTLHGISRAGFTAGIAMGNRQMHIGIDTGFLYTAPFGEYLSFYSVMQFSRSAPETVRPFRYQGAGPALGFFYHYQSDYGTRFGLMIDQLGFIRWNAKSYSYSRDTTFTFEGIQTDNIFQMEPGWEKSLTPDTLDFWFNRHGTPHTHYTSLPARIQVYGEHHFAGSPFALFAQAVWMPNTLMKPMFTCAIRWHILPSWAVARSYSWGGYSRFSSGLSLEFNGLKFWKIRLESHTLIPSLDPSALYKRHVAVGVVYQPAG